ncbi:MAG: sulfatase-like hydrolase/transferase, partial [Porticoccaceae bacterium]|nr:sulfatase-like hydrolase/transferase [Porticoccaceae bacterium]
RGFFDSNGPLRGKKRDLYEGGIRVPMIARWPGSIKAGATTDHLSAFWDMMPTFCELAAADHCPQGDGISLLPTLLGSPQKQQQHAYLYWEFNEGQGPIQAVRRGQWKLISFKGKPPELYDLDCDLGESRNVAGQYPQVVAELTRLRDKARSEHPEFPLRRMPNPWGK